MCYFLLEFISANKHVRREIQKSKLFLITSTQWSQRTFCSKQHSFVKLFMAKLWFYRLVHLFRYMQLIFIISSSLSIRRTSVLRRSFNSCSVQLLNLYRLKACLLVLWIHSLRWFSEMVPDSEQKIHENMKMSQNMWK